MGRASSKKSCLYFLWHLIYLLTIWPGNAWPVALMILGPTLIQLTMNVCSIVLGDYLLTSLIAHVCQDVLPATLRSTITTYVWACAYRVSMLIWIQPPVSRIASPPTITSSTHLLGRVCKNAHKIRIFMDLRMRHASLTAQWAGMHRMWLGLVCKFVLTRLTYLIWAGLIN